MLLLHVAPPREARTHAQSAADAGVEVQHEVAPGLGPVAFVEGALGGGQQRLPGGLRLQLEWRGPREAVDGEQRARRRIGRAHAAAPVDDEHAVLHLLDHQAIELRLLARKLQAAARGELFAGQPSCQLAGQQRDDEEATAGEPGLRHQHGRVAAGQHRMPGRREQHQRDAGRRGQRQQPRRQHTGHQHRQHEQRHIVQARAGPEHMQRREGKHIGADGGQPLRPAQPRVARHRPGTPETRQQPQRDGLRGIQHADQHQRQRRARA